MAETGYVSPERVLYWTTLLRNAAESELGSSEETWDQVRKTLTAVFGRFVDGNALEKAVPGIPRYTKAMVRPKLLAELDRRIVAAADLIAYNRGAAVEATLRRFNGWSTSIPPGGDSLINKIEAKAEIAAPVGKEKYHKRLVQNDQGHKLIANVSEIVATDAGAIAGKWNSHFRDKSYDARKDHAERDGKYYVVKGSWADERGLLDPVYGYYDDITHVGVEVSCRCWITWVTSLRNLPDRYLTKEGQEFLAEGKAKMMAAMGR